MSHFSLIADLTILTKVASVLKKVKQSAEPGKKRVGKVGARPCGANIFAVVKVGELYF